VEKGLEGTLERSMDHPGHSGALASDDSSSHVVCPCCKGVDAKGGQCIRTQGYLSLERVDVQRDHWLWAAEEGACGWNWPDRRG
jgi:hypothetical protein